MPRAATSSTPTRARLPTTAIRSVWPQGRKESTEFSCGHGLAGRAPRQVNAERASGGTAPLGRQAAAMRFGDGTRDRQAQTRAAAGARGVELHEAIEDTVAVPFRDARARVCHMDLGGRADRNDVDPNQSSRRRVLYGV